MSNLGEWGDADEADSREPNPWLVQAVAETTAAVDVAGLTSALVDQTVQTLVTKKIKEIADPIVAAAVEEVFTTERQGQLAESAARAAEDALLAKADSPQEQALVAEDDAPRLYYGSIDEFVADMIVPVFMRRVGGEGARRWSATWWESTEAIMRLEALWRSWEHLRLDPATGMSVWLRDHLDHHLAVLMDPDGPFSTSQDKGKPGQPLPYAPPPEEMFPDVRDS